MKAIAAIFTGLFMILAGLSAYAEVVDKIAVVVNGEIITQGEIDRLLIPVYEKYSRDYRGSELIKKLEEARQGIIQQLIEERLIASEAKRLNIEADDQDVEDKIKESMKRFATREDFENALREQRVTLKDLKAKYKEQIVSRKLVDQKIGAKIILTPVEVQNFYNKNAAQFEQPARIRLRNILIRPKSDADAPRALNQAKDILNRIKEGCDFAGLAKQYSEGLMASEGGLLGYSRHGDLMPEIEKAVAGLKVGETTGVVETRNGYYIFKLEERDKPKVPPLTDIRREVEEALFKEKINEKMKGWIEGLKKNAYIAFK